MKIMRVDTPNGVMRLRKALDAAEAVLIGAGAGLSTSAGYVYTGERFDRYFGDFAAKYHFQDMYSGGFYPYPAEEERWAFWSRYIWINRYTPTPWPVYERLLALVKHKDYFVLTTNVDHCFQKAGFDKERLFYTQGDYGLLQCSEPCHKATYDNQELMRRMVLAQGYRLAEDGSLLMPERGRPAMRVPTALLPRCPRCGRPMTTNLRADDRFVEDEGWQAAGERYMDFIRTRQNKKTLFLELAVGWNTPGIIKAPFWEMAQAWPDATYAAVNAGDACAPDSLLPRAICINGDVGETLSAIGEAAKC